MAKQSPEPHQRRFSPPPQPRNRVDDKPRARAAYVAVRRCRDRMIAAGKGVRCKLDTLVAPRCQGRLRRLARKSHRNEVLGVVSGKSVGLPGWGT